ncbi:hypothetical protein [Novosphingobium sp. AP12]|uniref:hypothetical protein n=1 Tax=Novosphingobium sp. AP12 TaxID=1144305 RepID=UPI000271E73A|nr:hypothetical protein [Novosphingobium sp. AP12]EJL31298.1 hypothetical protein PMI02_01742 [Novosphingobium sp. AP12]
MAALLVAIVHLEVLGAALGQGGAFFDLFAVGVDLFFVINGFIMMHTHVARVGFLGAFFSQQSDLASRRSTGC